MVSANREMVVYCFDTLVAHYNSDEAPPPAFDDGQHPLFVTWKKVSNGSEPRLRGCIGTLEARALINGFKDYALTRRISYSFSEELVVYVNLSDCTCTVPPISLHVN
ncbi:Ammecr1 family [Thalictrum thalictroides]|uniref:Ammecr1 family n=1 Tax=Thalictrum thalictroides TaxID=46969 RepID=A0A7J6WUG0_THATH|nr:Ammecr1 family [Thalictrum thalictroides]